MKSVVLLVDVADYGVLGLVVNRATEYKLAEVIPTLQDDATVADRLYLGATHSQRIRALGSKQHRALPIVAQYA